MTHALANNVINFEQTGRRRAIAKLTKNYSHMLAHIMSNSMLDDGEHVDDDGLPMCRPLDRTEMRHGAVANAALYLSGLIAARENLESDSTRTEGLGRFSWEAGVRARKYFADNMGTSKIVVQGKYKRDLVKIEGNYAEAIFTGLRIEAQNNPDLNEAEYWADVFRAFADHDPSGIVLRAAGLVLLDHLDDFAQALAFHTYQGEKAALGRALKD
jgi:hypothetical protein